MSTHAPDTRGCPAQGYWWDLTHTRHTIGKDRQAAALRAEQSAAFLASRGEERITVSPIRPDERDGYYLVRYSVWITKTQAEACRCP